jgi:hypothetical protein
MTRDDLTPALRRLIDHTACGTDGGQLRTAGRAGYTLIAPAAAGREPEPLCNFARRTIRDAIDRGLVLCSWGFEGRPDGFLTPVRLTVLGSTLAVIV